MTGWLRMLWDAMWPNVFAPSAITLAAIVVSHMLHRKAMATHVDKLRAEADAVEKRLHDRIESLLHHHPAAPAVTVEHAAGGPDHAESMQSLAAYIRRHGGLPL